MKKSSLTLLSFLTGILLGALGIYALTQKNQTSSVDPRFEGMLRHSEAIITEPNFHCENLEGRRVGDVVASMVEMNVAGHGRLYSRCGEEEGAEFCDFVYSSCTSASPFAECWDRTLRGYRKGSSFDTGSFVCTDTP